MIGLLHELPHCCTLGNGVLPEKLSRYCSSIHLGEQAEALGIRIVKD